MDDIALLFLESDECPDRCDAGPGGCAPSSSAGSADEDREDVAEDQLTAWLDLAG